MCKLFAVSLHNARAHEPVLKLPNKDMPLLSRGRLSVQPVSTKAYEAICLLGEKGEFEELSASTQPKKSATKKISKRKQDTGALDAEQESAAPDAQPRTQDRPKRTKKA